MTKRTTPHRGRLKYWFDNYMSRGGGPLFVILVGVFVTFVVVMFLFRLALSLFLPAAASGADTGPVESAIVAFLQTFDPGYMAGDLGASQWFLGVAVIAGVGGIILVAILIAFTNTSLERSLRQLRKGKSDVDEEEHTLILGWDGQRVVEIIKELAKANEESVAPTKGSASARAMKRRRVVVVLADQDKEYMDDYLKLHVSDRKSTRLVTRSGNPSSIRDLKMVSAPTARSAIVLSGCSYAASNILKKQADARVIKTLLALDRSLSLAEGSNVPDNGGLNVVADLFHGESRQTSEYVNGHLAVVAIDVKTVLARILLQTSRSIGLSEVYRELFSFDGAEIYVEGGSWAGQTLLAVSDQLVNRVPIGILRDETVMINPPGATELQASDRLIVLAEDDSMGAPDPSGDLSRCKAEDVWRGEPESTKDDGRVEKLLLVGWGPKTLRLLNEYAGYVDPASTVHIIRRRPDPNEPPEDFDQYQGPPSVTFSDDDPVDPSTWGERELLGYTNIIILSDGDREVSADVVDAKTITILLLLRHALSEEMGEAEEKDEAEEKQRNVNRPTIVTELLESDNQVIAPDIGLHDFVISSRIVSMLFAQASEDPTVYRIYDALFQEEGSEIYIKPVTDYELPKPDGDGRICFRGLMRAANMRGETCIGVKIEKEEKKAADNYGLQLIHDQTEMISLSDKDSLIVLAESDR